MACNENNMESSYELTVLLNFFPLKVGNIWYYDYKYHYQDFFSETPFDTSFVVTMTILYMENDNNNEERYTLKIDSLYKQPSREIEVWVDKENGDFYYGHSNYALTNFYKTPPFNTSTNPIIDTKREFIGEIFGTETEVREVVISNPFDETKYYFAKNYGLYSSKYLNEKVTETFNLRGCIINNTVYGDTSLTN